MYHPHILDALKLLTVEQRQTLSTKHLLDLARYGVELTSEERSRFDFNQLYTLLHSGIKPIEDDFKRFEALSGYLRLAAMSAENENRPMWVHVGIHFD